MGSGLGIGEVARRAGIQPSAIRYYEEVGLLAKPPRVGGKRRYDEGILRCLSNIEGAKRAGFTIGEMRAFFGGCAAGESAQERLRDLARGKLDEVDASISQLLRSKWLLEAALRQECGSTEECASLLSETVRRMPVDREET